MNEINILEEMANFTFTSKYAKYDQKKQRRETWDEAVSRVEKMHLKKFKNLQDSDKKEISWAFDMVRQKFVSPSMRSMQFGGKAIEAKNTRMFNCGVRHIDSLRSFAESFYALLCGCGVTFGLSAKYLSRLPDLVDENDKTGTVITYVVEDTIEGWSDSVEALLNCYFKNTPYTGRKIIFDYSKIRKKGTPLKTSGGKAPGYKGLKNCHLKIKKLLDQSIEEKKQKRLLSINAYDILMHVSDAVLSGGIRRAACAVIFDENDEDMLNAKTGDWFTENPQRARSNNSVLLLRKSLTKEKLEKIISKTIEFGEPGFVFSNSEDNLLNPCFSIDTRILTENGWRNFGELIGKTINIHQDNRILGKLVDGKEVWDFDYSLPATTVINKAQNIRKTASNRDIYRLTLNCGRTVDATSNHHFATTKGMVELKDLSIGDEILIAVNSPYNSNQNTIDYQIGYLAGLIFGDGVLTESSVSIDIWNDNTNDEIFSKIKLYLNNCIEYFNHQLKYLTNSHEFPEFVKCNEKWAGNIAKYRLTSSLLKQILTINGISKKDNCDWLHYKNKDFKSGFVSGLFYSDGHVEYANAKKSLSIRLTSVNYDLLKNIQLILQELGSLSRIYNLLPERMTLLPDSNRQPKLYKCQKSYRLVIDGLLNCKNSLNFLTLKSNDNDKVSTLVKNKVCFKTTRNTSKVISIEFLKNDDVYCLEENERRTLIANGLSARRCFEVNFIPVTEDGRCGIQFCNLSSINGAKVKDLETFKQATKAATIIGTLQASYTEFPYFNSASKELTEEEALLGVSITGMMDNPEILLNPEFQEECSHLAVEINKEWSKKIGINQAARITLVKPEGTNSIVLGSASGIHPHHSRKYFRRIQVNKEDNVYKFFKMYNEHACEASVWSANKTDDVITFPVSVPENAMVKQDLTALSHLKHIKSTQRHWVDPGTTDANAKDLKHSVSCTVIFKKSEINDVIDYLFKNKNYFTAVSLLADTGDKIYKQAPMEAVVTEEDEKMFQDLLSRWDKVDYSKLQEIDDETSHSSEASCAGGKCEVVGI